MKKNDVYLDISSDGKDWLNFSVVVEFSSLLGEIDKFSVYPDGSFSFDRKCSVNLIDGELIGNTDDKTLFIEGVVVDYFTLAENLFDIPSFSYRMTDRTHVKRVGDSFLKTYQAMAASTSVKVGVTYTGTIPGAGGGGMGSLQWVPTNLKDTHVPYAPTRTQRTGEGAKETAPNCSCNSRDLFNFGCKCSYSVWKKKNSPNYNPFS